MQTSRKLLPGRTTSYSFWLLLSSCSYINFPNVQVTAIAACFMCLVTSFHFSRLNMGCQNASKKSRQSNLQKFRKYTVSSGSRFGNIKEVCFEDWKMSLYKLGQFRVRFCWVTEKFQIIEFKISFYGNNFCLFFIQGRKLYHI